MIKEIKIMAWAEPVAKREKSCVKLTQKLLLIFIIFLCSFALAHKSEIIFLSLARWDVG
jgi:hypothetical protein